MIKKKVRHFQLHQKKVYSFSPWMTTHCHDSRGKVSELPINECVNKTFIAGFKVKTITFEMVARAMIVFSDRE